jgi:DNA-binding FrmR family transcriptional regulator
MQADKKKVTTLLKTARGQIDGLLKMIEEDRYCIEISNQILAAESILKKANREVLQAHIACCIRDAILNGNEKEKLDEMMSVLEKMDK